LARGLGFGTAAEVFGEETLEEPGGASPIGGAVAAAGFAHGGDELALELGAGGFEEKGEIGVFGFPPGKGGGADAGQEAGGGLGDAGVLDVVADLVDESGSAGILK